MQNFKHPLFIISLALKYGIAFWVFGDFYALLHDNLDSEIVYNVVKGRYLASFFDSHVFDVFLGGEMKWYYFDRVFSPLTLLYAIFPPYWAYLCTEVLGLILAYWGMLVLLDQLTGPQKYNQLLAVVFAFGLSYSGIGFGLHIAPFVLAYPGRHRAVTWRAALLLFFLGTLTSFVLHGLFFPIAALAFLLIFQQGFSLRRFILVIGCFSLGSLLASSTIFMAMLQQVTFHRVDWPLETTPDAGRLALTTLGNILSLGPWYHAQYTPALIALFTLLAGAFSGQTALRRKTAMVLAFIATASLLGDLSGLYAAYLPAPVSSIQFGRIGFFSALFLLTLAAFILAAPTGRLARGFTLTGLWVYLGFALLSGAGISLDNLKTAFTKPQQQRIIAAVKSHGINAAFSAQWLGKDAIGWSAFRRTRGRFGADFQEKTYSCFAGYITKGRAITFGYDPMVAPYNGIPVLDGYHNLYPRAYKYEFLKIIAAQLPVSTTGPAYFMDWGNRVYSFVETPDDIRIDYGAVVDLGGRYVISRFAVNGPALTEIASECGGQSGFHLYEIIAP